MTAFEGQKRPVSKLTFMKADDNMAKATGSSKISRLDEIDALRALALLGILCINIWFFANPARLTGSIPVEIDSGPDQIARFVFTFLFEAKAYVVFSFLFGISFVLAWARSYESGADDYKRATRRSVALIAIGIVHGLFLFTGDILLAYGILGFALLSLRNISNKAALITAGSIYGAVSVFLLLSSMMAMAFDEYVPVDEIAESSDEAIEAYTGTIGQWFEFQASVYPGVGAGILFGQGTIVFSAFLVGLVVGRSRILERIASGEISSRRVLAYAIPSMVVGMTISAFGAVLNWGVPWAGSHKAEFGENILGSTLHMIAGPFQAFGYVAVFMVVFRFLKPLTKLLAPAGRMSLSNYLGQSVVLVIIFSGLGFGLAGRLDDATTALIALALWTVQILFSHLWLRTFKRGPIEAPFRAWTYYEKPSAKKTNEWDIS